MPLCKTAGLVWSRPTKSGLMLCKFWLDECQNRETANETFLAELRRQFLHLQVSALKCSNNYSVRDLASY